jgi:hypothetical protein
MKSIACCRRRWKRGAIGGLVFAVLAVLMPKCPMCIAAWLGVIGLSGLAMRVDPRAAWLAISVATALAVVLAASILRKKQGDQT